ncbi:MAG: DUF2726 domain-containing protein [Subdoligranulum sp.]|nr:DUF2726 domain-containing protein [Subdoligranulum sp.]
MSGIAALLIFAVVIEFFLFLSKKVFRRKKKTETMYPYAYYPQHSQTTSNWLRYKSKTYFFTKNELYFYRKLLESTKEMDVTIFSKVRLADIIEPNVSSNYWQAAFQKIMAKHVDFLICDSKVIRPLLVIELDDSSHQRADRVARDAFVDGALGCAHVPILHCYGTEDLRAEIEKILATSFSR